jgi:ArsR family transcriptional regulator, arsenate/arsenite/antimonite-responsive transcriptional repressor
MFMTDATDDLAPLEDMAGVFKALSDPTRLAILTLLMHQDELCVCDIESVLGITQSRSSRHLRYLLHAGLVTTKRVGPWSHYRINTKPDADRAVVLETLRATLLGKRDKQLKKRLTVWARQKAKSDTCVASPTDPR